MKFDYHQNMEIALQEAGKAYKKNEIPVGAIIVNSSGKIISSAHNLSKKSNDITDHAEIIAIRKALKKLSGSNNNRLENHSMYVTLEPCPMCAQAISFARLDKLIYGTADKKSGGVENGAKIFNATSCHHQPEIISGIMEEECSDILKKFFKEKRILKT